MSMVDVHDVLLVEDDDLDAELIGLSLRRSPLASARIRRARSLAAARDSLAERPTDVVLLDLGLPDTEGTGAVDAIGRVAGNAAVVVVTGSGDDATALTCLAAGADDFLPKADVLSELGGRSIARAVTHSAARAFARSARLSAASGEMTLTNPDDQAALAHAIELYDELFDAVDVDGRVDRTRVRPVASHLVSDLRRWGWGTRHVVDLHLRVCAAHRATDGDTATEMFARTRPLVLLLLGELLESYRATAAEPAEPAEPAD
ncbi:MAG: response regulator [Actinomycetota bacterium]|nr:response regulator [Actinomycetota bacterium]